MVTPPAVVSYVPASAPTDAAFKPEEWAEITSPAFGGRALVTGIATKEAGALMYGVSHGLATVWTSADLTSWIVERLPESAGFVPIAAAAGGGVTVVATVADGGPAAQTMWRDDGSGQWDRIEGPLGLPKAVEVRGLAWSGSHFVAVGATRAPDGADLAAWRAGAWTSVDALNWHAAEVDLDPDAGSQLTDVGIGPGGVVAVGRVDAGASEDGLVEWSLDGAQPWSRTAIAELETTADDRVTSIVASTGLWLATSIRRAAGCGEAMCAENHGAVVTSADGRTWDVVAAGGEPPAPIAGWGPAILAYTAAGDAYQVVESTDGHVWSSVGPATPPSLGSVRFGIVEDTLLVAGPDMTNGQALSVWSLALPGE